MYLMQMTVLVTLAVLPVQILTRRKVNPLLKTAILMLILFFQVTQIIQIQSTDLSEMIHLKQQLKTVFHWVKLQPQAEHLLTVQIWQTGALFLNPMPKILLHLTQETITTYSTGAIQLHQTGLLAQQQFLQTLAEIG